MNLQDLTHKIDIELNPHSTVLYGSRARTDFFEKDEFRSDYEIALLFMRDKLKTWLEIRKKVYQEGVNIYPFVYEDFLNGTFDTPFQKRIFKRELIVAGKTISGEKVIEELDPPEIRAIDLYGDIRFNNGYALASVTSFRNQDFISAQQRFSKSCLFATRDLIMFDQHEFPTTYSQIIELSEKLDLGIHRDLVRKAYNLRERKIELRQEDLINNVSYLSNYLEPRIAEQCERDSSLVLVA